jgi:hypothetical protein
MSDAPILVTGAAGGPQGSSGNWVSRFLLERGVRVRAFVHRIDERLTNCRHWVRKSCEATYSTLPRCGALRRWEELEAVIPLRRMS